jgi:hypothetical protein
VGNPARPEFAERFIVTMKLFVALQIHGRGLEDYMPFADRGSKHFKLIADDAKTLGYKLREIDYVGNQASVRYVEIADNRKRYTATVPLDHQNNAAPGILSEMQERRKAEPV